MHITLDTIKTISLDIHPGDTIFLYGDLWSGKTTLVRMFIERLLEKEIIVRSPTYTYFSFFEPNIYHFDLFRIQEYETFLNIWAQDIFEDPFAIRFVEWPELIENYYLPTIVIHVKKVEGKEEERMITITRNVS